MAYIVALIIIAIIIAWFTSRPKKGEIKTPAKEIASDCCGAHEVCDKNSLLSSSDKIVYFADEELDRFINIPPNEYSQEQIEEFRDVLYTLKENEVADWIKSIQTRQIELPEIIREEALLIISEIRGVI